MNRFVLSIALLAAITLLTGCFKTEMSLLEDVTDLKYNSEIYSVCNIKSGDSVNWLDEIDIAVAKARMAGISQEQISAAWDLGQLKAEREIEICREKRKKEYLEKEAKLTNKCTLENKVVCNDRCCTKEVYEADAAASAAFSDAAVDGLTDAQVDAQIAVAQVAAQVADAVADGTVELATYGPFSSHESAYSYGVENCHSSIVISENSTNYYVKGCNVK